MMQWDQALSVGVPMIDAEHQGLIALINELSAAVRADQANDVLATTLNALIAYTATHFEHEELEMARSSYPLTKAHTGEHRALKQKVLEIQAQYRAGRHAVVSLELATFLKAWLVKHIQGSDQNLGAWLKAHNPRRARPLAPQPHSTT
jgi:hemerythrin-like metal-binding protein